MLNNCKYNKIKLLHELSCMTWFLEKHAIQDAQNAGENDCIQTFKTIKNDLEKHIATLENIIKK